MYEIAVRRMSFRLDYMQFRGIDYIPPMRITYIPKAIKDKQSVFCFLSPFFPVLLVVARNTIRNPIVFRAKIGQIAVVGKGLTLKSKDFVKNG